MNFVLGTAGLSMLALLAQDGREVLFNLAGLVGPFAVFAVTDFLVSHRRMRHRAEYLSQLYVAVFATTAAGIAATRFGGGSWQELLFLNTSGAFISAALGIIIQHHVVYRDESVHSLELFRGAFCGVWTSFAGMVVMAAQDLPDIGAGIAYFAGTMVLGIIAHEAGLRVGGRLNETVLEDDEGGKYLILLARWLPYLCSYIGAVALLKHFSPTLGLSYIFAFLGCLTGDIPLAPADLALKGYAGYLLAVSNEMLFNILGVAFIVATRAYCSVAASRKAIALTACKSPVLAEMQNTYAGAISVFCGSVQVAHSFVLALLPEDVKDDLYYDPRTPGSNSMRELGIEIKQDGPGQLPYASALATRLAVEASLVVVAFAVKMAVLR
ncbi:Hypothetical Protein FCC1311_111912 [Hondaea fermentalgiana]|uniref:Uncharacterized protein n=1 Tax=Hondaea fermentalgiana TaxID=2315210 RepID=A0A2R5GYS5_9STRA|nr:Hypothetical Protein FCC1311_111912 [Hondaea fermentalgiana]|eukprot:GBG34968.1 Hypothetical Protein FCC1311_111912 [Hondaea fermentalgiana]